MNGEFAEVGVSMSGAELDIVRSEGVGIRAGTMHATIGAGGQPLVYASVQVCLPIPPRTAQILNSRGIFFDQSGRRLPDGGQAAGEAAQPLRLIGVIPESEPGESAHLTRTELLHLGRRVVDAVRDAFAREIATVQPAAPPDGGQAVTGGAVKSALEVVVEALGRIRDDTTRVVRGVFSLDDATAKAQVAGMSEMIRGIVADLTQAAIQAGMMSDHDPVTSAGEAAQPQAAQCDTYFGNDSALAGLIAVARMEGVGLPEEKDVPDPVTSDGEGAHVELHPGDEPAVAVRKIVDGAVTAIRSLPYSEARSLALALHAALFDCSGPVEEALVYRPDHQDKVVAEAQPEAQAVPDPGDRLGREARSVVDALAKGRGTIMALMEDDLSSGVEAARRVIGVCGWGISQMTSLIEQRAAAGGEMTQVDAERARAAEAAAFDIQRRMIL